MARLLLVEDDHLFVRLYHDRFTIEGFEVDTAKDGLEGMEKVQLNPPNLIVLDLMMPRSSGFEMLQQLKADQKLKDIPVVVLTNVSSESDEQRVRNMGAEIYLIKADNPPDKVVAAIIQVLG